MPEPLTPDRLEWIRRCNREDKARHGASWEDHGEPAERHRDELLAEVDRLNAEHERQMLKLIDERDHLADLLDKFAAKVAPVEVIGEHSSGNDPWANALDLVTPAAEVERLRSELADLEGQSALTESHFSSHVAETIIEQDALKKRAEQAETELATLHTKAETRLRELATNGDAYRKVGKKAGAARQDYAAAEIRAIFGIEWKPGGGEPRG